MSGWIKMETSLRTHPKVGRMAAVLKSDRLRVIGGLHAVWCVFDEHTADGWLPWYTLSMMDEAIGWKGFSQAMADIGWLEEREEGLQAPDYEEHNSASAKRRALDSGRKKSARDADKSANGSWNSGGQMSAFDADTMGTREELDKSNTPVVPGKRTARKADSPPGFDAFWTVYPRKTAKADALKAYIRLDPDDDLQAELMQALRRQCNWPQWTKDDGQFIPYPASWLNARRWEDAAPVNGTGGDIFEGAH